jgi:uncharacterized protein (TIGR02001 family)
MRKSILAFSAFALAALTTPAMAEDDDGLGLTITGGASLVSDYRFRGFSQSNEDFAIQGNVTVTHSSGAYVGFWGSSNQGQGEIDVIGGISHELIPGLTGDIGVTYYLYPNRTALGTPGAGFTNGLKGANELVEPYASVSGTVGPVWAKLGIAWAPKQDYFTSFADGKRYDNTYLWTDGSIAIPNTPLKVTGHAGWTSNHYLRSAIVDADSGRTKADVIDYGVGLSASYKALTFGVQFVGTDLPKSYRAFTGGPRLRELVGADNTVVFSIGAAF